MAGQKDFITAPKKISKTLVFDFKQFYKYLRRWFQDRQYVVVELEYGEKVAPDDTRIHSFVWYTEKRADEFTKQVIEMSVSSDFVNVRLEEKEGNMKTAQKGTVNVTIQGYILKDTEDEWALSKDQPHKRILRELYDKMVARGTYAKMESQLKNDMDSILSDLKTYLKTHNYD